MIFLEVVTNRMELYFLSFAFPQGGLFGIAWLLYLQRLSEDKIESDRIGCLSKAVRVWLESLSMAQGHNRSGPLQEKSASDCSSHIAMQKGSQMLQISISKAA